MAIVSSDTSTCQQNAKKINNYSNFLITLNSLFF